MLVVKLTPNVNGSHGIYISTNLINLEQFRIESTLGSKYPKFNIYQDKNICICTLLVTFSENNNCLCQEIQPCMVLISVYTNCKDHIYLCLLSKYRINVIHYHSIERNKSIVCFSIPTKTFAWWIKWILRYSFCYRLDFTKFQCYTLSLIPKHPHADSVDQYRPIIFF